MRIWFALLLFPSFCFAESLSDRPYQAYSNEEMFNITSGAILQREDAKLFMKNFENWGWEQARYLGLSEKYLNPIIVAMSPLIYHKFSTRGIQYHWEPLKNLTLRPDLEYHLDSSEVTTTFSAGWKF